MNYLIFPEKYVIMLYRGVKNICDCLVGANDLYMAFWLGLTERLQKNYLASHAKMAEDVLTYCIV
jgi:hypothetical protein